jgi:hypothetical protein
MWVVPGVGLGRVGRHGRGGRWAIVGSLAGETDGKTRGIARPAAEIAGVRVRGGECGRAEEVAAPAGGRYHHRVNPSAVRRVRSADQRSGARAAEEAALEMPYTVSPYRGFKSLPLR